MDDLRIANVNKIYLDGSYTAIASDLNNVNLTLENMLNVYSKYRKIGAEFDFNAGAVVNSKYFNFDTINFLNILVGIGGRGKNNAGFWVNPNKIGNIRTTVVNHLDFNCLLKL